LLAAGAAAGMSAIFGSPVAAVLLAIELLLFEFRPRSIIPVALASAYRSRHATLFSKARTRYYPMPDVSGAGNLGDGVLHSHWSDDGRSGRPS